VYEFLEYRVEDVMSRPVTLALDDEIGKAQGLLEEHGFNALPVVDADRQVVGWVTSLDLLRAFDFPGDTILPCFEDVMHQPVERVMSREVYTVRPRTPLSRVISKLVDTRSKSFPVLDDDDRLIGIVAREDVMRALKNSSDGRGS
jgi:CBS-domain-containing membrane protein